MRRFAGCVLMAAVLGAVAASCANIESIASDVCGNAVVDPGEDCDLGSRFAGQTGCRAPGSEGECRFDCAAAEDGSPTACPTGFGCGADAICRAPSGALERQNDLDEGASILVPGDLDGDGTQDLLAQTSGGVLALYLREGFDVDTEAELLALGSLATFDMTELTGDTYADVAFTDLSGVGVLRGAEGRELVGTAYPSFSIPADVGGTFTFALDALADDPGVEPLAVIQSGPLSVVVLVDSITLAPDEMVLLSPAMMPLPPFQDQGAPSALVQVPSGQIDPATPCEEWVLAYKNTDQVFVGTPCLSDGSSNGCLFDPDPSAGVPPPVPIRPVELDLSACGQGFQVDRAFVLDANGDGFDDVVVTPEPALVDRPACFLAGPFTFPAPVLDAAEDCGFGHGTPIPDAPAAPLASVVVLGDAGAAPDTVLAIEDIDGDTVLDVVSTLGIFVSREGSCPATALERPQELPNFALCDVTPQAFDLQLQNPFFTAAAIGELNGGGGRDVVLTDVGSGSLNVCLGHSDDTFAAFSIDVDGRPDGVQVGDFDGDGVDDIVYADRPCGDEQCLSLDETTGDALMVAYGRASAGPETPRNAGRLGRIQHIVTGRFPPPYGTFDATVDVGVLSARLDTDASLTFATLYGSTERQLQAPFGLNAPLGNGNSRPYWPVLITSGQFVEPDGSGGYQRADGGDALDARPEIAVLAIELADVDLDEAQADQLSLWLLATDGDAEMTLATLVAPLPNWDAALDVGTSHLVAGDVDGDGGDEVVLIGGHGFLIAEVGPGPEPRLEPLAVTTDERFVSRNLIERIDPGVADARRAVSSPAELADLDGDGLAELVAIGRTDDGGDVLVVFWNSGGTFSAQDKTVAQLAPRPAAFAIVDLDGDAVPEIVVADDAALSSWKVDRAGGALAGPSKISGWQGGSERVSSLAAADFDADGVRDLAVGTRSSIALYRMLPGIE